MRHSHSTFITNWMLITKSDNLWSIYKFLRVFASRGKNSQIASRIECGERIKHKLHIVTDYKMWFCCNFLAHCVANKSHRLGRHDANLAKVSSLSLKSLPGPESDFTDREYQEILPPVARSTASRAIKSNLTATEIMAEPDISTNQRRTNVILQRHAVHKSTEKALYPGELAGADAGGAFSTLETAPMKNEQLWTKLNYAKSNKFTFGKKKKNMLRRGFEGCKCGISTDWEKRDIVENLVVHQVSPFFCW